MRTDGDVAQQLRHFIGDVVVLEPLAEQVASPPRSDMSGWCDVLERDLALLALPVDLKGDVQNVVLAIADHLDHGPLLLKTRPSIFLGHRTQALVLARGITIILSRRDLRRIGDARVLLQPLPEGAGRSNGASAEAISTFMSWPMRGLARQAFFVQVVTGGLNSWLFIININLLAYVVPGQSLAAYGAVALLFAVALATLLLVTVISVRLNTTLRARYEEREEVARLSLMSLLQPHYIQEVGSERALAECSALVGVSRARSEAHRMLASLAIIIPVLILTFLRLPALLFVVTAVISLGSVGVKYALERHLNTSNRELAIDESRSNTILYQLVSNIAALRNHGLVERIVSAWQEHELRCERQRSVLSRKASLLKDSQVALEALALAVAFAGLGIMVSLARDTGAAITVGTAFIVTSLVSRTFQLVPTLSISVAKLRSTQLDVAASKKLLGNVSCRRGSRSPRVTRADAAVDWSGLGVHPGCHFKEDRHRNLSIDGRRIVRIAGESGSGKSALLRCLCGLQAPAEGSVRVLGVDPIMLSRSERRRIFGYVDHTARLLPGSIRENLQLFCAGSPDRQLWDALDRAMVAETVGALPMALDTPIRDVNRTFSTGERQRLVLAQTILKKSAILVLDEAIYGVPEDVELRLLSNIRPLVEQIYFVSHRDSSRAAADLHIEMELRR